MSDVSGVEVGDVVVGRCLDLWRSLRILLLDCESEADSLSSTLLEAGSRATGTSIAPGFSSILPEPPSGSVRVREHFGQLANWTMQCLQM